MSSTSAAADRFVITFGYNNFTQGPNKRIAKCKICGIPVKDSGSTTSKVIRHLKSHRIGVSLANVNVNVSVHIQ